jgi:hypothetical protein
MKTHFNAACTLCVLLQVATSVAGPGAPRDSTHNARGASVMDMSKDTPKDTPKDVYLPTLGGNLPKVLKARADPYFVTADLYVPSGKTVTLEPGCVLLFNNFTGLHVEGKLVAEGTKDRPIVFSSEFDQVYNAHTAMHANPYDWDGIYIHEGGIGTSLSNCKINYSVYGINSLTKYIMIANVVFRDNGRSDLTIEGTKHAVSAKPYSFSLTIADARKDGVPVKILMDPMGKKRTILRYCGIGLCAAGCVTGIWSGVQAGKDEKTLNSLKDTRIAHIDDNLYQNSSSVYNKALQARNRDRGFAVTGFALALLGAAGVGFSFTF